MTTARIGTELVTSISWSTNKEGIRSAPTVDIWHCANGVYITINLTPEDAEVLARKLQEDAEKARSKVMP